MIVFLDTNIVVYFIENPPGFGPRANHHHSQLRTGGHILAVSDLARMECRVHPVRHHDVARLALFDNFFALPEVRVFPILDRQ